MQINNILAFCEVANMDFYGPGYVSSEILKKGLKAYWDDNDGYDAIILNFSLVMHCTDCLDVSNVFHWNRYCLSDYSVYEAIRYADRIVEDVQFFDVPKILLYQLDTIRFPLIWERKISELLDNNFYLWSNGLEFFPKFEETEITRSCGYSHNYYYFCKKYSKRIISMSYSTTVIREFYGRPLCEREFDVTVPGNLDVNVYPSRGKILEIIKKMNLSIYNEYGNRTLMYRQESDRTENSEYMRYEDKMLDIMLEKPSEYMNSHAKRESIQVWRENYNIGLRKSKMAYADGGVGLQLVRKYSEIPARGTLMLCEDIPCLKNYGFIDGENVVIVTQDDFENKVKYLLNHIDKMQEIANNGKKMVLKKHSAVNQARLILNTIDVIKEGSFGGSRWENGEFIVDKV